MHLGREQGRIAIQTARNNLTPCGEGNRGNRPRHDALCITAIFDIRANNLDPIAN